MHIGQQDRDLTAAMELDEFTPGKGQLRAKSSISAQFSQSLAGIFPGTPPRATWLLQHPAWGTPYSTPLRIISLDNWACPVCVVLSPCE